MEAGRAKLERSLELASRGRPPGHVGRAACTNLARARSRTRRYELAERYIEEGIAYCAEPTSTSWLCT